MSSEVEVELEERVTRSELPLRQQPFSSTPAQSVWAGVDLLPIARSYAVGAIQFLTRLDLIPGESVLDVGCGTGNLAIPAARAGARVSGIDIAPNLIAQARLEARVGGLTVDFEVGDFESLPYEAGRFDATMSMFGAMFAYRPERVLGEMLRVTRSGGRIAMANWTPDGFMGRLLRAQVAAVPPAPGTVSPLLWGDEGTVRGRLGDRVRSLTCARRRLELRFAMPPDAVAELFATSFGPTLAALQAADAEGRRRLRETLARLWRDHNLVAGRGTAVSAEYLEVQAWVA